MRMLCAAFLLLAVPAVAADAVAIPDALEKYVAKPEPAYSWKLGEKRQLGGGAVYPLHLVSQTWQGIDWEHALTVYEPAEVRYPNHMLLFVTGGRVGSSPRESDIGLGLGLAGLCGARVATIHQVPNQPLLGDHVEDDLITETWLKYLETGDESWPLLFPMVKSAVKAMDALEEFSLKTWDTELDGFVISGASKRGWTSWLTPVTDERIIATAPIVIDTLNFQAQMTYQLESWGKYSEQIADYTSKGLVKPVDEPRTPREERLMTMMDPYTYRSRLTLPKLLINGTNDRYWVVDAMKNYWDDLEGPKYILAVPNVGHGLGSGLITALNTLAAFFRHAASGQPLPEIRWKASGIGEEELMLTFSSDPPATATRLWSSTSTTKDFRESTWTSKPTHGGDGEYVGTVTRPADGHAAMFGELFFTHDGLTYSLTTIVVRD